MFRFILQFFLIISFYKNSNINCKFLQTVSCRVGGSRPTCSDLVNISKFDLLMNNRFNYYDGCHNEGDYWNKLHALNPDLKIFLYQLGGNSPNGPGSDSSTTKYLSSVGRYNVDRGHSMGDLNNDNPHLFLKDSNGDRLLNHAWDDLWMDYGNLEWADYLIEATMADVVNEPHVANGVFFDVMKTLPDGSGLGDQVKYTEDEWIEKTLLFYQKMTDELGKQGQYVMFNKGHSDYTKGSAAWIALDEMYKNSKTDKRPFQFDEGAFACWWGPIEWDVQFYPEATWKKQIDTLSGCRYSNAVYISHSRLKKGESGTDNWGDHCTHEDIFWYCMGSFHIGKNDVDQTSYWQWTIDDSYADESWWPEFEHIDLGSAMDIYEVMEVDNVKIYYRNFERGYIYVNPNAHKSVTNIELPEDCYLLNHDNFFNFNPENEEIITSIDVVHHRAVFLMKKKYSKKRTPVVQILIDTFTVVGCIVAGLIMLCFIIILIVAIIWSIKFFLKKKSKMGTDEKYFNVSSNNIDDIGSKSEMEETVQSKSMI